MASRQRTRVVRKVKKQQMKFRFFLFFCNFHVCNALLLSSGKCKRRRSFESLHFVFGFWFFVFVLPFNFRVRNSLCLYFAFQFFPHSLDLEPILESMLQFSDWFDAGVISTQPQSMLCLFAFSH
jgi:hypothetical protein